MAVKTLLTDLDDVGVYVGYPGTAAYNTSLSQYVAIVGAAPTYLNLFIDMTVPMSQWAQNSRTQAIRLRASTYGSSMIPVVSVPLISNVSNGLTELQNFATITSGADDSVWLGIVKAYQAQGYTTIDLRLGEEQNGTWYPWSVSTPALAQAYVAAFDHISALVHNVVGIAVNVIWNPSTVTTSVVPTVASYPGNAYVDMIGIDTYDLAYPLSLYDWSTHTVDATLTQWESNPVNLQYYWTYPDANTYHPAGTGQGFGIADAIAFARTTGKPLAFPEIGAGGNVASAAVDDAIFPQYLATALLAAGVPIAFANIWDSGAYMFSDGSKPNEAAAWASFVTAMTQNNPSAPAPGLPAPQNLVVLPAGSAIDYSGNVLTNDPLPAITGSASQGDIVEILIDGASLGYAPFAAATSQFSGVPNAALTPGRHAVTAFQLNPAATIPGYALSSNATPIELYDIAAPVHGVSMGNMTSADLNGLLANGFKMAFISGTKALQVIDGSVSIQPNASSAIVERLYIGLLGRMADPGGLAGDIQFLNNGGAVADLATGIIGSAEYQAGRATVSPAVNPTQFVTGLYEGFLSRAPDPAGLTNNLLALSQGASTGTIVAGIADSPEAQARLMVQTSLSWTSNMAGATTDALYQTGLGREPEPAAVANNEANFQYGGSPLQLAQGIVSSPEFAALDAGMNLTQEISGFYTAGLGRPPDTPGLQSWVGAVQGGSLTLAGALLGIAQSPEAALHLTPGVPA